MSYAKRIDANQNAIVKFWREIGATVWITSRIGKGGPDAIVGARGVNFMVELKDGSKPLSQQKLTIDEQKFHESWKGQICIVRNMSEALRLLS